MDRVSEERQRRGLNLIRESNTLVMLVEEGMAALCEVFLKFVERMWALEWTMGM